MNATRMHSVVMNGWKPPLFEIWAEWGLAGAPAPVPAPFTVPSPVPVPVTRNENQLQNSRYSQIKESYDGDRHRDRDSGVDRDQEQEERLRRGRGQGRVEVEELKEENKEENKEGTVTGRFRQLLGLSRFPPTTQLNDMTALLVCPVGRVNVSVKGGRADVVLVIAVYIGESTGQVERVLLNALTPHKNWTKCPVENPYYHIQNSPKSVIQSIQNSPNNVPQFNRNSPHIVSQNTTLERKSIENESVKSHLKSEYGNEDDDSSLPSSSSSILPLNNKNTTLKTPLTNVITPTMTSSIIARNESSRSAEKSSDVHILDFSIDGVASFLTSAGKDAGVVESMMGCYIVYTLPRHFENENENENGNEDEDEIEAEDENEAQKHNIDKTTYGRVNDKTKRGEKEEVFKMWWDVDCPVLNSRARHVFRTHTRTHSGTHTSSKNDLIIDYNNTNSSFIDTTTNNYGQLHDKNKNISGDNNDTNDVHNNTMKNNKSIQTMQNNKTKISRMKNILNRILKTSLSVFPLPKL